MLQSVFGILRTDLPQAGMQNKSGEPFGGFLQIRRRLRIGKAYEAGAEERASRRQRNALAVQKRPAERNVIHPRFADIEPEIKRAGVLFDPDGGDRGDLGE